MNKKNVLVLLFCILVLYTLTGYSVKNDTVTQDVQSMNLQKACKVWGFEFLT